MYFHNLTTLFVKYSYLYFSSHGVYGSKVKKRNKHQYVNECHLISHHWSNMLSTKCTFDYQNYSTIIFMSATFVKDRM